MKKQLFIALFFAYVFLGIHCKTTAMHPSEEMLTFSLSNLQRSLQHVDMISDLTEYTETLERIELTATTLYISAFSMGATKVQQEAYNITFQVRAKLKSLLPPAGSSSSHPARKTLATDRDTAQEY